MVFWSDLELHVICIPKNVIVVRATVFTHHEGRVQYKLFTSSSVYVHSYV